MASISDDPTSVLPKDLLKIIKFSSPDTPAQIIGKGTYGTVLRGTRISHQNQRGRPLLSNYEVACKIMQPASSVSAILEEITCCNELLAAQNVLGLSQANHVVQLQHVFLNKESGYAALIFNYVSSTPFKNMVNMVDEGTIKLYVRDLLLATQWLHYKGYVHIDIKPTNYLYDVNKQKGTLCDFGMVRKIIGNSFRDQKRGLTSDPNLTRYNPRPAGDQEPPTKVGRFGSYVASSIPQGLQRHQVDRVFGGTKGYRSPEVMLDCAVVSPALDMYSIGIMLLCLLLGKTKWFLQATKEKGLAELVSTFGYHSVMNMLIKLDIHSFSIPTPTFTTATNNASNSTSSTTRPGSISTTNPSIMAPPQTPKQIAHAKQAERITVFKSWQTTTNANRNFSDNSFDLVLQLLSLFAGDRPSATQALAHKWFLPTATSS